MATFQTDFRGSQIVIQPGVTYVLHFWGLGIGNGFGMTINGLNNSPFYTTQSGRLSHHGRQLVRRFGRISPI